MIWAVLPMALEVRLVEPPMLETLACTVEASIELFICRVVMGMLEALESASRLLPKAEFWITASPAILLTLALSADDGSEDAHFWKELTAVRVGSVEMPAPLHTAWLEMEVLPQMLETLVVTLESMAAFGPTIWLF